jgi:hypothetical protein
MGQGGALPALFQNRALRGAEPCPAGVVTEPRASASGYPDVPATTRDVPEPRTTILMSRDRGALGRAVKELFRDQPGASMTGAYPELE